jgi:hypothetical protein
MSTTANKAIPFGELSVGMTVYNPQSGVMEEVTDLIVGVDNTKVVFLNGNMYGEGSCIYKSEGDCNDTQDNFKKAKVIGEAFLWGTLPTNITEEQLDLIISWING